MCTQIIHRLTADTLPAGEGPARGLHRGDSVAGRRCGASVISGLAVALLLGSASIGLAQTVDTTLWVTDRSVFEIVRDGARVFIAGDFTYVGPPTGGGVAIDANTGEARKPYARVSGTVYAVAPDGKGGWYLGGNFSSVQGQARSRIAHVDADGELSAWNPGANATVWSLAVSAGRVYVGGDFTVIGGQPRNRIAALDAVGGTVSDWDPSADGQVRALAVSGGTVFVGGGFHNIGGQPRNYIAALDAANGTATAWNADAGNEFVLALAVSDGTVYASFSPFAASRIVALDVASGATALWSVTANNFVYALAVSGGTVYVGGNFSSIAGQPRVGIAALDAASGVATAWNPSANGGVAALAVSGSTLFAGGGFTSIGGQLRNRIAALEVVSGAATPWNPNASDNVWALGVSAGTVYAGGSFISVGGQTRVGIAALDAASGAVTAWDANANHNVNALVVSGNTIYVGGYFTRIGGQQRFHIAALDATSAAATAWDPGASAGAVIALGVTGGTVYAGGDFVTIGGQLRVGIAAVDAASGAATAWNAHASHQDGEPSIQALAVSGGTVYVGGFFTSIGGQPRNYIAALDTISGAATSWNPDASYEVHCLAVSGSTVYAGGQFASMGGKPRNHIAAIDIVSGDATPWNPNAGDNVWALAVSGDIVYAGGAFTSIGGQPRSYFAALDAATGVATAWNPNANGQVRSLAVSANTVYVGGEFTSIAGQYRPHLAAVFPDFPTSTLLARFDAMPAPEGIELRWRFGEPGKVATVAVERGTEAVGPWQSIAPELHDESGVTVALDRTAECGGTYFYRLVVELTGGGQAVFGPVSASRDEPLTRSGLTLVSPNPSPGGIQVQYGIARAGQVRLELFDVSGRVVATLADRVQGPGRYVAAWDGAGRQGRVPPGLYFVRLEAPDQRAVRKLAIVR